ncbi:hypothetical protein VP01_6699g1, partial [Puccinia sorghi]
KEKKENPTPVELQKAKETFDSFHSLDLVIVDQSQSNHGKIIVIIEFTSLDQLSKSNKKTSTFGAIFTKAMLSTSSTIWMCFKNPRQNKDAFFLDTLQKVHWVYSMKWIWLLKLFLKESTAARIIKAPYTFRKLIKNLKDTLTSGSHTQ